MKKRSIIITLTVIAAIVAVALIVLRIRKKSSKEYDLTSNAQDYLQIYRIDNSAGTPQMVDYMYHTGASKVKANANKAIKVFGNYNGIDGMFDYIPVSKVIFEDGKKHSYNPTKDYILMSNIVTV